VPVPLSRVRPGTRVRILSLSGGRGLVMRLYQMGLVPGEVIEVVMNNAGPVVVLVRGVSIALGKGMASKILVEPV